MLLILSLDLSNKYNLSFVIHQCEVDLWHSKRGEQRYQCVTCLIMSDNREAFVFAVLTGTFSDSINWVNVFPINKPISINV